MNHNVAAFGSGTGRVGMAHQGRKRWAVPTLRVGRLVPIALVALCAGQPSLATAAGGVGSPPGNRLEKLSGDRRGQWSIRINDRWRVCFRWTDGPEDVEVVDYH